MCTLYKGKPFGLAKISCIDDAPANSFDGIGVFNNGVLHKGPLLCNTHKGKRRLFTHMIDGRPADDKFSTYFFEDGHKREVECKNRPTDVSGG
jgi:hypothetical protein